jgi:hypothetical protein
MVWLDKPHYESIDYLAFEARKSKKAMAELFITLGIGVYMTNKMNEYNAQAEASRKADLPVKPTHFVRMLRRWARDMGVDISTFI